VRGTVAPSWAAATRASAAAGRSPAASSRRWRGRAWQAELPAGSGKNCLLVSACLLAGEGLGGGEAGLGGGEAGHGEGEHHALWVFPLPGAGSQLLLLPYSSSSPLEAQLVQRFMLAALAPPVAHPQQPHSTCSTRCRTRLIPQIHCSEIPDKIRILLHRL
jgi:hypothetical protein